MNMFARFDENPMTLQDIKETKHYRWTDAQTDGQCENSIIPTKVCGGYNEQDNNLDNSTIQTETTFRLKFKI